jgi:ABC-type multidrug transport system fused ATPase/permease subunit
MAAAVPVIGLYAFATHRLMPSLQAIFRQVTAIRFSARAVDILYEDLRSLEVKGNHPKRESKEIKPLPIKNKIELKNVSFTYPSAGKPVIKNLNLKIKSSSSIAFAGETGAGKTTAADIILGLLRPQSGKIIVDGVEITDENLPNWQRNLGYIPQDIYLHDDTVAKNIAFGVPSKKIDREKIKEAAKIANIDNFIVNELLDGYETPVGERGIRLSGGQKQRIGIARALYRNCDVLVLDEATSALDGVTETEIFKAINNVAKAKTLIMIAHRLTTVKNCDVIYLLEEGKITASGRYDELMKKNRVFRKMAKAN